MIYTEEGEKFKQKKRIWAALKRKVTIGVGECEACQRYSGKKEAHCCGDAKVN